MHDSKFCAIRKNAYQDLADYNTISFTYVHISQYESCEDFISKLINDKFVVQELSSPSWASKAVLDAKRDRQKLDELEKLTEVEEDDITSSEDSDKSKESDGSEESE